MMAVGWDIDRYAQTLRLFEQAERAVEGTDVVAAWSMLQQVIGAVAVIDLEAWEWPEWVDARRHADEMIRTTRAVPPPSVELTDELVRVTAVHLALLRRRITEVASDRNVVAALTYGLAAAWPVPKCPTTGIDHPGST
jgi:hypothetical protein